MEYEIMYLISEAQKTELPRISGEITNLVTKAGGVWSSDVVTFEQKLAYEIKHQWRGTYTVQRFILGDKDTREQDLTLDELPVDTIAEITRQMNLHKDVLRYIIVKADELPPLEDFTQKFEKGRKEEKTILKEKGEKIDGKLEKVLKI